MNTRMIVTAVAACLMSVGIGTGVATADATNTAPATQPTHEHQRGQFEAALSQLDLSSAQRQRIDVILADTKAKLKTLKDNGSTTDDRQQRRTIVLGARRAIMAALTPAQREHLRAILQADRSRSST